MAHQGFLFGSDTSSFSIRKAVSICSHRLITCLWCHSKNAVPSNTTHPINILYAKYGTHTYASRSYLVLSQAPKHNGVMQHHYSYTIALPCKCIEHHYHRTISAYDILSLYVSLNEALQIIMVDLELEMPAESS